MDATQEFFTDESTRWILASVLATVLAMVAYRAASLSISGAMATIVVGAAIVAGGGWWVGVVLVIFFVSSSALSRAFAANIEVEQVRGKRRDAVQVIANGGVPVAFALLALMDATNERFLIASCGAIAGAAADTWATETGRLGRSLPRLVTTGRRVPTGTSGAISAVGSVGSAMGALLIAVSSAIGTGTGGLPVERSAWSMLMVVFLAGVAGSLADSVIGATLQARRLCPVCDLPTEQTTHRCGSATRVIGGIQWITNDVVNAMAIAIAGGVALALA